jgi:hypothetical protein
MKLITSTLFALTALVVSSLAADNYPVFHTNNVILFQGDSITDGGRQRTGQDYNHIMGQSYAYIIADWCRASRTESQFHQPRHRRQHGDRSGCPLAEGHPRFEA